VDIIVPPADIQLGEVAQVFESMDKVVDERERIPILHGDCIQSSVVLDEVKISIFLLDEQEWSYANGMSPRCPTTTTINLVPLCSMIENPNTPN
jgi:hypothetical protein